MLKLVVCVSLGVLLYTSSVFSQDDSSGHLVYSPNGSSPACVDGPSSWYEGKRGYTKSGTTCQRWDVTTPHKPRQTPRDGGHHNFCRNPDGDLKGTWCYTMNVSKRWEYCDIPKCPDDSRVIWTNYDSSNGGAHILSVQADPEIVKNMTDHSGTFSVNVLVTSNQSRTEYWAVAADYNHNLFFYTDYMSEYIGVYYLKLNASEKKYEGMAHGIENMAYDWLTGNLYWTDSEFQWIMATEKSFTYYTPVYRTEGSPPYAITIHAKQRKLFFSIYKTYGSRIVSTDLAGKNETTIFQYPKVFDVTGLTIDYTDDRLYWTDFTGFGGMVLSSKTDGTNKTQHHYKGGAIFWGVSAYLDYLYVTDVHARYNTQAKKYYSVWVINKKFPSVFRYTLEGKPRGISVLSKNEERSMNTVPKLGSCMASNLCDHICLPRIGSKRECACSLGYTKVGDTKCVHNTVNDNYLLIADGGQGKVFQIDISQDNLGPDSNYSIVPLRDSKRISTVAVDVVSKTILWSDKRITQIKKALLDGSRTFSLTNGNHASSIAVDSLDGNVYFVDEDTQIIYVTTSNGRFTKTLSRPGKDQLNSTHIKMLTVDSRNSYLYWTDTRDGEDNGQVLRMKTDGTKREVVLDKLQWPHAITIDYERNSLFVAEAKLGMIYEKSLSNLTSITSTSSLSAKQQYDLAGHITRMRYYIVDIKVLNNTIYVIDGKSNRVEKFNLTAGPASITQLGPTEFYKITSIALYSEAYHKQYIANIPNPCSTRKYKCDEICLATSSNTSTCACADGKLSLGSACYEKLDRTVPPSYGTTCQRDQTLQLFPCQGKTRFTWNEPQWTDDRTASEKLSITKPSFVSPALLPIGDHVFTYTATDSDGNAAACSFTIIVQAKSNCMKTPELPPHLKQETKPCNLLWGAEYVVRCKDDKMMMMLKADVEKQAHRNITNMCLTNGSWYLKDWSLYSCITAPTTPAPGPKDKPTASSNGSGVNKSSGGGLATGPIVAIVIMVILLVVVIIAVIFVSIRNRPVWKVTRFAFPLFGKQKTEDTDTTQPSENPYSVMT